jgi:type I restriction enzyme, S subunit
MKLMNPKHPVQASWIRELSYRLDARPFISGALEARKTLEALKARKDHLSTLTQGGLRGIYHAGREGRTWVNDPDHGVPFLSSSDILNADLSTLPLMSKRQVASRPQFVIHEGWTLITRSGTIGRTVYARGEMDGLACSEHVMRVVPDVSKVPPGYLYAFISSKYGIPIVISGTYGSIIQSIEPEHIATLPVPRFGKKLEQQVHELVQCAADLRTESNKLLRAAKQRLCEITGHDDASVLASYRHPDVQLVASHNVATSRRFDAFFYSSPAQHSDALLSTIATKHEVKHIGEVTKEVFETTRFGRLTVDDPDFGVAFHSISTLVQIDPKVESMISRRQATAVRAMVDAGWLILPRVGQLQGVFGTAIFIPSHLSGIGVSDNNIRIVPRNAEEGAYIWAALSTRLCYLQIIRRACGTSIPYLDASRVRDLPIPWVNKKFRDEIAATVIEAMEMRSKASRSDASAIAVVEGAIEENA